MGQNDDGFGIWGFPWPLLRPPPPGPLLVLLLAQTLRHGPREGCKIALTPLVTDAPIIVVALVMAAKVAELRPLLGLVSIAGGAFVLYLAWDSIRPTRVAPEAPAEPPRSWFKGIFINLLSPHPWLFWLTVGGAILAKACGQTMREFTCWWPDLARSGLYCSTDRS
jgi:threonine/homoserine/homoserine lactone efflux protein